MCWGFECGDGWYNILDNLCETIQNHINGVLQHNKFIAKNNAMIAACKSGDWTKFEAAYSSDWYNKNPDYVKKLRESIDLREESPFSPEIPQVVALQVKEKYGALRFYISGGDDYVEGVVSLAESLSEDTCEICGSPGERNDAGWIMTRCEHHRDPKSQL
jgi:hypothetical protein